METEVSLRVPLELGAHGLRVTWAAVRDRSAREGGGFELEERGVR